jgi:molybdopterin-guanine dinucleotide biosynthesis protein A
MISRPVAGAILAGGASARMGGHKPFMPFRGASLIDAVIARVGPQVSTLALDIPPAMLNAYRVRYSGSASLLPDNFPDTLGPLCGVITGLEWLATLPDTHWLATFPCDTPFLPHDLVSQLAGGLRGEHPVVTVHGGEVQGVCALWPRTCLSALRQGLEAGTFRSVRSALEAFGATEWPVAAPDHAFFNVNTPDDLKIAETLS